MGGMLIAWLPVLAAVVGLLLYLLATNGKVAELGRLLLFVGLFFTVWGLAGEALRFGHR
jgi:Na+/phosphate symporter